MNNVPKYIIVHHTAVSYLKNPVQWPATNTNHKQRFNFKARNGEYGGYHLEIAADGEAHRFRDDDEVGAHCKEQSMNFKSIGICLDMNGDIEEPTLAQKKALLQLISEYQGKYHISDNNVIPHRFFATGKVLNDTHFKTYTDKKPYKTCWGEKMPDDILGYLKMYPAATELSPAVPHYAADEDKFFTDLSWWKAGKNLDEPPTRGEMLVFAKHLYDALKR